MAAERVCDVCGWLFAPTASAQVRCRGACMDIGRVTRDRLGNIGAGSLLHEMLNRLRRQYFQCIYCRCPLVSRRRGLLAHIDHIEPTCRGGTDELENLQWICVSCNRDKGQLPDSEFRAVIEHRQAASEPV